MNQAELNEYFGRVWRETSKPVSVYEYTGLSLADKIRETDRVLDVGCGPNPFKGLIKNLVGIDPAFLEADYQLTLEQFSAEPLHEKFDVVLCLGSVNFGTRDNIENQIQLIVDMLKEQSTIYWRCNPGLADHKNEACKYIEFYPWSFEEHYRLADKFRFAINEILWDKHNRIYAKWKRL